MFDLKAPQGEYELPIFGDRIVLTVTPMTTATYYAAQTAASRRLKSLEQNVNDVQNSGFVGNYEIDLSDEDIRNGLFTSFYIEELAVLHVRGWKGVVEGDAEVEPTPDRIRALVSTDPIGKRFFEEFTLRNSVMSLAKKDLGLCASGTTDKAQNTAKNATNLMRRAQRESVD